MKDHDDFIERLKADLAPVTPWPAPERSALVWFLGTVLLAGLGLLLTRSLRADLRQRIAENDFIFSAVWLLLCGLLLTMSLSWVGRPGRSGQRGLIVAALASVLAFPLLLAGQALRRSDFEVGASPCLFAVLMLSMIPSSFLFAKMRRLAPVYPSLSGTLIGLAAGSAAAMALSFSCANDGPAHLLVWHWVAPLGLLSLAGAAFGRVLLRW